MSKNKNNEYILIALIVVSLLVSALSYMSISPIAKNIKDLSDSIDNLSTDLSEGIADISSGIDSVLTKLGEEVEPDEPDKPEPMEPVTLDFFSFQVGSVPWEAVWTEDLIPLASAQYPDIEVNFYGAGYANYWEKAVIDFQAGMTGDLYFALVAAGRIYEWAAAGWLEPLDDYLAGTDILETFQEGPMEDVMYDGKIYGIPGWARAFCLVYSKSLFEEAGISTPIEGTDAFNDALLKLSDIGVYPLGSDVTSKAAHADIWRLGTWAYSGTHLIDDQGELQLNSAENLEAVEYIGWLIDNNLTVVGQDYSTITEWIADGQIAMMMGGPWMYGTFEQIFEARGTPELLDDIGFMASPFDDHRSDGGVGAALVMPSAAKDKDAAWKFMEVFAGPEMQLKLAERTGSTGCRIFSEVPGLEDWIAENPHQEVFIQQLEEFGYRPQVLTGDLAVYSTEIWKIYIDHAQAVWLGSGDLEEEMNAAQAEALALIG